VEADLLHEVSRLSQLYLSLPKAEQERVWNALQDADQRVRFPQTARDFDDLEFLALFLKSERLNRPIKGIGRCDDDQVFWDSEGPTRI